MDLGAFIRERFWGNVVIEGNSVKLLNLYITGKVVEFVFVEEDDVLVVKNFLMDLDDGLLNEFVEFLSNLGLDFEVVIRENILDLLFSQSSSSKNVQDFVSDVFKIYDMVFERFPNYSVENFGVKKIFVLGAPVYIFYRSLRDVKDFLFISGNYLTRPDVIGRYQTNFGEDNLHAPILCWQNNFGEFECLYVDKELGWKTFNLTRFVNTLNDLAKAINFRKRFTIENIFTQTTTIYELLEESSFATNGGKLPTFLQGERVQRGGEKLDKLIRVAREEFEKFKLVKTLDDYIKNKTILKMVAHAISSKEKETNILGGEEVITTNIRSVSKLGGGKAIYIGKDELNHIKLGEKAKVSVVKLPSGKKILVIEPM